VFSPSVEMSLSVHMLQQNIIVFQGNGQNEEIKADRGN